MSAGGAFGGNRGLRPVPPEKGVFPLDHMHECDLEKKDYLNCLKSSGHKSENCRSFSKKFLECRMEKNLMARQDMAELGFKKEMEAETLGMNKSERVSAVLHAAMLAAMKKYIPSVIPSPYSKERLDIVKQLKRTNQMEVRLWSNLEDPSLKIT